MALGFVRSLLEAFSGRSHFAYGAAAFEWLYGKQAPPMRQPTRSIGWAGPRNDIGPAHEIDGKCLSNLTAEGVRLFYSDEDIAGKPEYAEALAGWIARASSGIEDVRTEMLSGFRAFGPVKSGFRQRSYINARMYVHRDREQCRGITFRLSETHRRNVWVSGASMARGEHGGALFVLARAGEFNCIPGEMLDGDPADCCVLSRHSYCMK